MALLIHEADCHHGSCAGSAEGPKGVFSPATWRCDCPCHALTGSERAAWIKAHPTELERSLEEVNSARHNRGVDRG